MPPVQVADSDCLFTTVKNISGTVRVFGFLGPRGKRLAIDETITIPGNLITYLGSGAAANGSYAQRKFKGLTRSLLTNGSLEIVSTPAVHLYDPIHDRTKLLAYVGDQLGVVDPCWDVSGSSDFSTAP